MGGGGGSPDENDGSGAVVCVRNTRRRLRSQWKFHVTFSISARCKVTGMFGIAITSSSPAVAARCSFVQANAGIVATQNITDPALGSRGLNFLNEGMSAEETLSELVRSTPHAMFRQLAVVDRSGSTAGFSGDRTLGVHSIARGADCIAVGNLLANDGVPSAMIACFEATPGPLPTRLLAALKAGLDAGGEAGPVHSAGLKVARDLVWPIVDLRVDWADDPIGGLDEIWAVYEPQVEEYVARALHPDQAPSFGVAGDQ